MGILDGIVEWIAEQVMNILDLITTSVLGALGCSMDTFLRYFPAAETMYDVFLALALGLILLNWVWQLFKNYFMGAGIEAEDPLKLSIRSFIFIFLAFYAEDIVNLLLGITSSCSLRQRNATSFWECWSTRRRLPLPQAPPSPPGTSSNPGAGCWAGSSSYY